MSGALRRHWPEYLMEAAELGLFMISASAFGVLLEHPASPVREALPDAASRRVLMGVAMGLTAAALIYSPWGRRSGAHMNPATTLTFVRLGKVAPADAVSYAAAHFIGATVGLLVAMGVLGDLLAHPAVAHVATLPGDSGAAAAFAGEMAISFTLMTVVLHVSAAPAWSRFTGLAAGVLVALFISVEAPVSGMSLNPARTFASALAAGRWDAFWVYLAAPPLGMLLAAELRLRLRGELACAKLRHDLRYRCLFCGPGRVSGRLAAHAGSDGTPAAASASAGYGRGGDRRCRTRGAPAPVRGGRV